MSRLSPFRLNLHEPGVVLFHRERETGPCHVEPALIQSLADRILSRLEPGRLGLRESVGTAGEWRGKAVAVIVQQTPHHATADLVIEHRAPERLFFLRLAAQLVP